jgi:acyl-homoserine lactone acylase PvdQ
MIRPLSAIAAAIGVVALAAGGAGSAAAAPPAPGAYQQDDFGGESVFNIVPPGQNGFTNAADAAAFLTDGTRPPHQYDQNDMYADLVYEAPNLKRRQILDFFKDASFGVKPGNVEGTTNPLCAVTIAPSPSSEQCENVTIQRDEFGVPHIYGRNRAALMFGIGYATGMDRLFLADVLRHGGRGSISSFVGGAGGNRSQDAATFAAAPYANDAEYQRQFDEADDLYGADGVQVQRDVQNYVDGLNQWIAETRVDPANKLDALYTATLHPEGPQPWKVTDVIATGALVAGIFGQGGGGEIGSTRALQEAQEVLGDKRGRRVWNDFRNRDDREADRTVRKGKFPYRASKGRRGAAIPDPGSLERVPTVKPGSGTGSAATREPSAADSSEYPDFGDILKPLRQASGASNALLVSARQSRGGKPIAVFGPQTGYFAPQLLIEQDVHAPATPEHGPAIDARGVSFVGTNLYVQLGRGVDYSFSATSAGQDIIDTFAIELCEPDGSEPTIDSMHYVWHGRCLPIEVLERTNSWSPNAADSTPPGSETLQAFRTKAGLISHRGTIDGAPYAFTRLRATYKREVDAAASFADWNSPDVVTDAESWTGAGFKNTLTFNWFYADDEEIAYYNSGANPKRAPRTPTHFPVFARPKLMWKGYDPTLNTFKREPNRRHAQVVDQRFLTSWNNKQARGYNCDGIRCYTSVYRSRPLDNRIKAGIKGRRKMRLIDLINAMEDAGTVDLRGDAVLPWALRILRKGKRKPGGEERAAIRTLHRWYRSGAHRRDLDDDGSYDHAEAVKIIDAWWPLWTKRQFSAAIGDELVETFLGGHDAPGAIGSAFNSDQYGQVHKDLRSALGKRVKSPFSRVYCGDGKLGKCKRMLRRTLLEAASTSFEDVYGSSGCTLNNGTEASPQMCHDAVNATDVTVASVGEFHWINRPTFQQAVQYQGGR